MNSEVSPLLSERTTGTMVVLGSSAATDGDWSAFIAALFQVVIVPLYMAARTCPVKLRCVPAGICGML